MFERELTNKRLELCYFFSINKFIRKIVSYLIKKQLKEEENDS